MEVHSFSIVENGYKAHVTKPPHRHQGLRRSTQALIILCENSRVQLYTVYWCNELTRAPESLSIFKNAFIQLICSETISPRDDLPSCLPT